MVTQHWCGPARLLQIPGHPDLHGVFQARKSYIVWPFLGKKNQRTGGWRGEEEEEEAEEKEEETVAVMVNNNKQRTVKRSPQAA